jgi:hypothetical protein
MLVALKVKPTLPLKTEWRHFDVRQLASSRCLSRNKIGLIEEVKVTSQTMPQLKLLFFNPLRLPKKADTIIYNP